MIVTQLKDGLQTISVENFRLQTLVFESAALRENPLRDPALRAHPVLVPTGPAPASGFPVVILLAGFTGNGPNYFNLKTFETPTPLVIDRERSSGRAPPAIYVFVDAMTSWGGSQFVNSSALGRYEDFIVSDLRTAVGSSLPAAKDPALWCVAGGSSGGYGALSLASRRPDVFGLCAAIAPDSFFEASLLPEIRTALPLITRIGGVAAVRAELLDGRLMKRREAHTILNAIAMGLCYASSKDGEPLWPIDAETGLIKGDIWETWLRHDPIRFLPERAENLARLKGVLLDVGTRDQYQLQYGTRQIRDVLRGIGVETDYSEFDGTHFDIGERRPVIWSWLSRKWQGEV